MWKKFAKICVVLATVSTVAGCGLFDDLASYEAVYFTKSKWNPETGKYDTESAEDYNKRVDEYDANKAREEYRGGD